MREHRQRGTKRAVKQDLLRRIRNVIRATDDVADPHVDVVYDNAQVICRMFIRSEEHKIFDRVAFNRDLTEYGIFIRHASRWNPEPDGTFVQIRVAAADKTRGRLTVQIEPLRLKVGTLVPLKAEPGHRIEDASSHLFAGTFNVRILDTQDERAAMLS